MELTYAQQQALLNRAVDAVKERFDVGPGTDPGEVSRRIEIATDAVTDAVTRGGLLHSQIAVLSGVSGLRVIGLITDWSAQGEAIGRERHNAKVYADQVREAAASHARQRVGAQGYGAKAQIAREIGVTRAAVDAWIVQADAVDI
ncbi:hypothetical protein AB0B10_25320 [Micromonospora arborensis]|uniref:hypothetical protein n=1 Tax=Micromonospora arborensis TaxID=2116518 RepID=UPI003407B805